tara:strand:+ start:653 stop:775 length:123 start_codon:yes stop_codon:yes gene_type:complete
MKNFIITSYKFTDDNKKGQATYITPLNHLPLLPSGPGGIQ